MAKFRNRFKSAMQLAYDICKATKAGGIDIPKEDMDLLLKYEKLNVIKLTLPKIKLSTVLYYPTMQDPLFKGITQDTWVKIMLWATKSFNIKCGLTIASAASYRNSPHRYGFIEPVIVTKSDIGNLGYQEECDLFDTLKGEIS